MPAIQITVMADTLAISVQWSSTEGTFRLVIVWRKLLNLELGSTARCCHRFEALTFFLTRIHFGNRQYLTFVVLLRRWRSLFDTNETGDQL